MLEFLTSFLARAASRLTRIAKATKSNLRAKDLHGDVWIAASEIGDKRGRPVDFGDPYDQELVFARVYSQNRKLRDGRLHFAVSLDAENEEGLRWSERIGESVSSDPVAVLTRRAKTIEEDVGIAGNYSQYAAYTVALTNFDSDPPRLSAHLAISEGALKQRMSKAVEIVERQNSMFDGFEEIDPAFMPLAGREPVAKEEVTIEAAQRELAF
jgi:hypothetical protein